MPTKTGTVDTGCTPLTFVAQEVFDLALAEFGVESLSPAVMRRNVVTGRLNLN